jgi:hypothetical protein
MTTKRPLGDWGHVLGNTAAVGAILDRFLHRGGHKATRWSYRMPNRRELNDTQAEEVLTGQVKRSTFGHLLELWHLIAPEWRHLGVR